MVSESPQYIVDQSCSEPSVFSDSSHMDQGIQSIFHVAKMDCPSEENLIRTAFAGYGKATTLEFDIPNRKVLVYHSDSPKKVEETMNSIGMGARLISHDSVNPENMRRARETATSNDAQEAQVLKWLLAINGCMFVFELGVGIAAQSAGLIADSLDMFADAAVYLVALYAVGKTAQAKLKAAHLSGWLQIIFVVGLLIEVTRRAYAGGEPVSTLMMGMGLIALIANVSCLVMVFKMRNSGSHMKASLIFSANDVLANVGVIIAGILVMLTESLVPDLVIGIIISLIVLDGARRILLLR